MARIVELLILIFQKPEAIQRPEPAPVIHRPAPDSYWNDRWTK